MSDKRKRDTLFSNPQSGTEKFTFDKAVVEVFDDMIHRSVPGYEAIVAMIGVLAERYASKGSNCYDLGCSLGGVSFSIAANTSDDQCNIIAVDNSEAMIRQLGEMVNARKLQSRIQIRHEDIRQTTINNASVVVLNFVLQFLKPEERMGLLNNIYEGMLPDSILILSEKIAFDDALESEFQIDMHHEFKKLHGYSDLEISQKRAALEQVLIPDTEKVHMARLKDAGFQQVYLWFQCFNFISIVAVK